MLINFDYIYKNPAFYLSIYGYYSVEFLFLIVARNTATHAECAEMLRVRDTSSSPWRNNHHGENIMLHSGSSLVWEYCRVVEECKKKSTLAAHI